MFGLLTNLAKATVAVIATPVALAVDVVALPFDATSDKDAFSRTSEMLDAAGNAIKESVKI